VLATRERGFVFDRVVTALVLLACGATGAALLLTALGAFSPERVLGACGASLERVLLLPPLPEAGGRLVAGVVGGLVGLGALILLVRRLFPLGPRPASTHHVLAADDKGIVLVDRRGISAVAGEAIRCVPGVVDVEVRVLRGGTSAVRLVAQTWVHARTELAQLGEAAREQARVAVERLVGLDVLDVVVRIHVVPLDALEKVVE
jgi:hypothetical protein